MRGCNITPAPEVTRRRLYQAVSPLEQARPLTTTVARPTAFDDAQFFVPQNRAATSMGLATLSSGLRCSRPRTCHSSSQSDLTATAIASADHHHHSPRLRQSLSGVSDFVPAPPSHRRTGLPAPPVPKTKDVSLCVADAGKSPGFPGLLLLPGLENALLNRRERALVGGISGGTRSAIQGWLKSIFTSAMKPNISRNLPIQPRCCGL